MAVDDEVAALASRQAGAFGRWQVEAVGGDDALIRRRRRARRWLDADRPGVYLLAGSPMSAERELWVAWCAVGSGAVLGFESAAERHGLGPVPLGQLVLIDRHGHHHRLAGLVVHQLDDVLDHHVVLRYGMPTTTVERTIVDLAVVSSAARLARVVEGAVQARDTTELAIGATLRDIARRGKPGIGKLGRVLDERAPGEPLADSELERLLLEALLVGGLPAPRAQHHHPGRVPGKGRVDFAYPDARLILEADGRRWHQRIADLKRDRARDNEAARAGWLTLRFMHEELRADPADVAATVRETLAHREVEAIAVGIRQL